MLSLGRKDDIRVTTWAYNAGRQVYNGLVVMYRNTAVTITAPFVVTPVSIPESYHDKYHDEVGNATEQKVGHVRFKQTHIKYLRKLAVAVPLIDHFDALVA